MIKLKNIISAEQFADRKFLDELFALAAEMEKNNQEHCLPQSLAGKVVACMFFEPSTRTRLSFETSVLKLSGSVIGTENAAISSSAVKGETLEDTIRIISGYADAIVMRHPEEGAAKRAAAVSAVPIVNAGDGKGEHPTQALLDMFTIKKELGRLDNLNIALVGDLLYGRTVHSLLPLLSLYPGTKFYFIAPEQLRMPEEFKKILTDKNVPFEELENFEDVLGKIDVVYMTRVQKERFGSREEYEKLKDVYIINQNVLEKLKKEAIILHPLPRINEIAPEVDADVRAAYFRQARNGLYMRMALLHHLLGK
jgi:aspartate carbamoyltransferase catalytic subunit